MDTCRQASFEVYIDGSPMVTVHIKYNYTIINRLYLLNLISKLFLNDFFFYDKRWDIVQRVPLKG